jgi:hypothetical protein
MNRLGGADGLLYISSKIYTCTTNKYTFTKPSEINTGICVALDRICRTKTFLLANPHARCSQLECPGKKCPLHRLAAL